MIFTLFLENPIAGLILFAAIVVAIAVHEAAHAYTANWFGDDTPRLQGRLTFNPLKHLDPWGTLLILLVGIGWGRPVQFNPFNLKKPRRDTAIIAVAGPLSNIAMALVVAVFMILFPNDVVFAIGTAFVSLNIVLAVFNMLPIEPLDGFKVVAGLLPPHLALQWEETRKYGFIVLIALLITGSISRIVGPIVDTVTGWIFYLTGVFGLF